MFKKYFGDMSKFRAFSYLILVYALSVLGVVVPEEFDVAVFLSFSFTFYCFLQEAMTPADKKKRK